MENGEYRVISIEEPTDYSVEIGDVDSCVVRMQNRLKQVAREGNSFGIRSKPHICRAPRELAGVSERAVEPEIVSIGPCHRFTRKQTVVEFDSHKWLLLSFFLNSRARKDEDGVDLSDLVEAMRALESKARECYAKSIPMSSNDFVEMVVVDGCFILELFCTCEGKESDLVKRLPIPVLARDLLKVENQLPFFILQKLFDLTMGKSTGKRAYAREPCQLQMLALKFFNQALPWSSDSLGGAPNCEVWHLLHLIYLRCLPLNWQKHCHKERFGKRYVMKFHNFHDRLMPCVTQLREAGIKFVSRRNYVSFLDIKFDKGVLELPPITVCDLTTTLFLNCIAMEQCSEDTPSYFCTYIAVMSCLINSPRDVTSLFDDGIITNSSYNDTDVALLFKGLEENVPFNIRNCYLSKVFKDVEAYYNGHWSTLKRTYFRSPWTSLPVVSAVLLLILSGIQAIMSIISSRTC